MSKIDGLRVESDDLLEKLQIRIKKVLDSVPDRIMTGEGYGALNEALDIQITKVKSKLQKAS